MSSGPHAWAQSAVAYTSRAATRTVLSTMSTHVNVHRPWSAPRPPYFLRGGVKGRALPPPPNSILALSAGLRMRKEHMRLSSTAMTAPALSNSPQ